jgi:hypothetical protein
MKETGAERIIIETSPSGAIQIRQKTLSVYIKSKQDEFFLDGFMFLPDLKTVEVYYDGKSETYNMDDVDFWAIPKIEKEIEEIKASDSKDSLNFKLGDLVKDIRDKDNSLYIISETSEGGRMINADNEIIYIADPQFLSIAKLPRNKYLIRNISKIRDYILFNKNRIKNRNINKETTKENVCVYYC